MPNLMIRDDGAYGDQGFKMPALMVLRPHFEQIWVTSTRSKAKEALENTGLVDGFVELPEDFLDWLEYDQNAFLIKETDNIDFEVYLKTLGCIPGRLNFHKPADPRSKMPVAWRRKLNEGRNYFDEMSVWLGVDEAVGVRPGTKVTLSEINFLNTFREAYGIPKDAFMLGWQFSGSNGAKRIPHFDEIIQKGIMEKYPFVYVVGMGDLEGTVKWDAKGHGGRFINMFDLMSFREAYLLTSIMDCFVSPNTGVYIFSQCFPRTPKILTSCLIDGNHCVCGDDTTVLQSTAECSPCYLVLNDCKHDGDNPWFHCAGKIKSKRVIDAIDSEVKAWQERQ